MSNPLKRLTVLLITGFLLIVAAGASAHFLLNLNVRIFHIEHTAGELRVYARMPMPYLVADKIGDTAEGELPDPAPFTTNAMEDGRLVHYLDVEAVAVDPLGLGRIAEAGTALQIAGKRLNGDVGAIVLHTVGNEPGFATLEEARDATMHGASLAGIEEAYVGDVVVDVLLIYTLDQPVGSYSLFSTLDPGLPDQEMTANLLLDYKQDDVLVYRSRGSMREPIEVSRSQFSAFVTFVWEGIRHILEGIDHVLFVICLVIGAPALRDLLWRVTGFTAGHSVTLALGFFGYVPSGAWFVPAVETGIALSIIYAAVLAMRCGNQNDNANGRVVMITVLIGLLHGLGFSFVLQEILRVDSPNIWQSLLAFNLGVEIGQIAIVLVVWPLLDQVSRYGLSYARWSRISMALACSLIATWWTAERVSQVFWALAG